MSWLGWKTRKADLELIYSLADRHPDRRLTCDGLRGCLLMKGVFIMADASMKPHEGLGVLR